MLVDDCWIILYIRSLWKSPSEHSHNLEPHAFYYTNLRIVEWKDHENPDATQEMQASKVFFLGGVFLAETQLKKATLKLTNIAWEKLNSTYSN